MRHRPSQCVTHRYNAPQTVTIRHKPLQRPSQCVTDRHNASHAVTVAVQTVTMRHKPSQCGTNRHNAAQTVTMRHTPSQCHRIGKEQKAHSFDLFDAAATRRNASAPTAAMLLARSSQ